MLKPRDYQEWAVNALWDWMRKNPGKNPYLRMPTGVGKSVVIAWAVQWAMKTFPTTRVMMLTSSQDLIEQNYDKLLKAWENAPVGIYSAGLKKRESNFPIIYAGIGSVVNKEHLFGHIDLLFIDECDLVPTDKKSQFQKFISGLKKYNPHLVVVGLTATDWRTGAGRITEVDNAIFHGCAVDMCTVEAFNWFVAEGYLVPLTSKPTTLTLNTDGVSVVAGEYNKAQLELKVNKDEITEAALKEAMEKAGGRRKWLVFASGVDHAIAVRDMLNIMGIEARAVHSKDPGSRVENISWFRGYEGEEPIALVNNDILTTGFDDPTIDLIIILRPTKSSRLWVQMLGRGTRPWYMDGFDLGTTEGRLMSIAASPKQNCMVLDYAKNIHYLGPINDPVIPRKKGKGGPAPSPVKLCPTCEEYCHASVRKCPCCGHDFPEKVKLIETASQASVMKEPEPPQIECFRVDSVTYTKHSKVGSVPTMKVRYYCGLRAFDEYVCIEHPPGSFPSNKATRWWRKRVINDDYSIPSSVDIALMKVDRLRVPTHLSVIVNKKYPEITDYCFDGTNFGRVKVSDPSQLITPKIDVQAARVPVHATEPEEIHIDDIPF